MRTPGARGARWEWDQYADYLKDQETDESGLVEAGRAMAKKPVYDALSIEEDRAPITRYMGGLMGESMAFPNAIRNEE